MCVCVWNEIMIARCWWFNNDSFNIRCVFLLSYVWYFFLPCTIVHVMVVCCLTHLLLFCNKYNGRSVQFQYNLFSYEYIYFSLIVGLSDVVGLLFYFWLVWFDRRGNSKNNSSSSNGNGNNNKNDKCVFTLSNQ